jgi:hypothetical protein
MADFQYNWFVAGNRQNDRLDLSFQPVAQFGIATINTISYHPLNGELSELEPFQHEDGQLRFGAEGDRFGNPG